MAGVTNGKRWAQAYPELGTRPVPIEPCISPAYFEQEREKLSTRVWLNVGREEEILQAGDYFVKDVAVCSFGRRLKKTGRALSSRAKGC